jgi:hypothetical protein
VVQETLDSSQSILHKSILLFEGSDLGIIHGKGSFDLDDDSFQRVDTGLTTARKKYLVNEVFMKNCTEEGREWWKERLGQPVLTGVLWLSRNEGETLQHRCVVAIF